MKLPDTIEAGDRILLEDDDCCRRQYIVAMIGHRRFLLIDVLTGNRFSDTQMEGGVDYKLSSEDIENQLGDSCIVVEFEKAGRDVW